MKRIMAALSVLAFSSLPALSQSIVGLGAQPCSKWLELQRTWTAAETPATQHWVMGYISSSAKLTYNRRQIDGVPPHDVLEQVDGSTIMKMMNDACMAKPAQSIDAAAAIVSAQLVAQPDPVVMAAHRDGMSAFAAGRPADLRRMRLREAR